MGRRNEFSDKVDKIIGMKMHELRISTGVSRQQLSSKIGVTDQQIQKYEKGANRIAAGRLAAIAQALNKPVAFFFEDIYEDVEKENYDTLPSQHRRMCIEVSRNFLRIKDPGHQTAVNLLVRTLSEN